MKPQQENWILPVVGLATLSICGFLLYYQHNIGNRSKPSSRPDSGSYRRRRPKNKNSSASKHSVNATDEHASSESDPDAVFSDDSLIHDVRWAHDGPLHYPNGSIPNGGHRNLLTDIPIHGTESEMYAWNNTTHRGMHSPQHEKHKLDSSDESDGNKRSIGVQTPALQTRVHSAGSTRTDMSEDFDFSFASGDIASLSRNMVMSPLSLWNSNDRSGSDSPSDINSATSSGVGRNSNNADRSMTPHDKSRTPTPRSRTQLGGSFFSSSSNLNQGPTEVWSSSMSDLRHLPGFREDLSYVIETECMAPGASLLDYTDDARSQRSSSFYIRTPREEKIIHRPSCSTPLNSARSVHIEVPESQFQRTQQLDPNTPVTYEVVVHEDNTNIMYNVEKTEYKTYSLRNQSEPAIVPDTVHVDLHESVTSQHEDTYESSHKEHVTLSSPDDVMNSDQTDSLILERSFHSSCSSEREVEVNNGIVNSDSSKNVKEETEENKWYVSPRPDKVTAVKHEANLQCSGVVEYTDYPGTADGACANISGNEDRPTTLNDSDVTSDYGTITSIEGKGFLSFTSDSEDGDSFVPCPSVSPRPAHVSIKNTMEQTNEGVELLKVNSESNHGLIHQHEDDITEGQAGLSVDDLITPNVVISSTQQSVPDCILHDPADSQSQPEDESESKQNECVYDDHSTPRKTEVEKMNIISVEQSDEVDAADEFEEDTSDSSSVSTVIRPGKDTNVNPEFCSQETLQGLDTDFGESIENVRQVRTRVTVEQTFADEIKSIAARREAENKLNEHSPVTTEVLSETEKGDHSSLSSLKASDTFSAYISADDMYHSLEQLESNSSTCSSDYRTPQQSPRENEDEISNIHKQIIDVVIPDMDGSEISLYSTPGEQTPVDSDYRTPQQSPRETEKTASDISKHVINVTIPGIDSSEKYDLSAQSVIKLLEYEVDSADTDLASHKNNDTNPRLHPEYDESMLKEHTCQDDDHNTPHHSPREPANEENEFSNLHEPDVDVESDLNFPGAKIKSHEGGVPLAKQHLHQEESEKADVTMTQDRTDTSFDNTIIEPGLSEHEKPESLVNVESADAQPLYMNLQVKMVSDNTEASPILTHTPAVSSVRQLIGSPANPQQIEARRNEITQEIAQLNQHSGRSLSDSAISSDGDSASSHGNRMYDNSKTLKAHFVSQQSPTHVKNKTDFDRSFVMSQIHRFPDKPFPLRRSVSLDSLSTLIDSVTDYSQKTTETVCIHSETETRDSLRHKTEDDDSVTISSYYQEHDNLTSSSDDLVFPQPVCGATATEGQAYQHRNYDDPLNEIRDKRMVVLDTNQNIMYELSSDSDSDTDSELDTREMVHSDNELSLSAGFESVQDTRSLSPGEVDDSFLLKSELSIDYEQSMSPILPHVSPEHPRSLPEDYDPFEQHNTSSSSTDSITFVFMGCDVDGQQHEYDENENEHYHGSEQGENVISSNPSVESRWKKSSLEQNIVDIVNVADHDDLQEGINISLSSTSSTTEDESDKDIEISTHSASEEIEIINCMDTNTLNSRELKSFKVESPSMTEPLDSTEPDSESVVHHVTYMVDEDEEPLRHRFGIDETVLPISYRSVSADNLPKQTLSLKDLQRSRSTSMLDVGVVDEPVSEDGIFPPILSYVDEDQTEPSISMKTTSMSDSAIDHVSQRTMSEIGVTYSRTSTSLDSETSTSDSSMAQVRSICSVEPSDSEEEFQEEIVIEYSKRRTTSRSTEQENDRSSTYEGEVDTQAMKDENHLREVLKTVEKFIMPRPTLVDRGTKMTPWTKTCLKSVSTGIQTIHSDSSTQTSTECLPLAISMDQIILPTTTSSLRAENTTIFDHNARGPQLVLSERSNNWVTLGELMVETTQLLRRINEQLPGMDAHGLIASSEESKAILQQWQEISVQTGGSINNLQSVGQQTEDISGYPNIHANVVGPETVAEYTQVDACFRMEPLNTCETFISDLAPGASDDIACAVSVETNDDTTAIHETIKMSIQAEESHQKDGNSTDEEFGENIVFKPWYEVIIPPPNKDSLFEGHTNVTVPTPTEVDMSDTLTLETLMHSPVNTDLTETTSVTQHYMHPVLNTDTCERDQLTGSVDTLINIKDINVQKAGLDTEDNKEHLPLTQVCKEEAENASVSTDLKPVPPSVDSISHEIKQHKTKSDGTPSLVSTSHMPELEELRNEHAKLMENLQKASDARKARKEAIILRKHISPTDKSPSLDQIDARLARLNKETATLLTDESSVNTSHVVNDVSVVSLSSGMEHKVDVSTNDELQIHDKAITTSGKSHGRLIPGGGEIKSNESEMSIERRVSTPPGTDENDDVYTSSDTKIMIHRENDQQVFEDRIIPCRKPQEKYMPSQSEVAVNLSPHGGQSFITEETIEKKNMPSVLQINCSVGVSDKESINRITNQLSESSPKRMASRESSLTSPQEITEINIGMDPNTGLTIENKTYTKKKRNYDSTSLDKPKKESVVERSDLHFRPNEVPPRSLHEQTWQLSGDGVTSLTKDLHNNGSRTTSESSFNHTSGSTSEVPSPMADHQNLGFDASRDETLNTMLVELGDIVTDVLGDDIITPRTVANPKAKVTSARHQVEHVYEQQFPEGEPWPSSKDTMHTNRASFEKQPYNRIPNEEFIIPHSHRRNVNFPNIIPEKFLSTQNNQNSLRKQLAISDMKRIHTERHPEMEHLQLVRSPRGKSKVHVFKSETSPKIKPQAEQFPIYVSASPDLITPPRSRSCSVASSIQSPSEEEFREEIIVEYTHVDPKCMYLEQPKQDSYKLKEIVYSPTLIRPSVDNIVDNILYPPVNEIIEDIVAPKSNEPVHKVPASITPTQTALSPRFGKDDVTQMSMELSDEYTQTDIHASEDIVRQVYAQRESPSYNHNGHVHTECFATELLKEQIQQPLSTASESSDKMTVELERLQTERVQILDLLSLSYLPTSLTVELLEAKLNYCIGQTDLLLNNLDENFRIDANEVPKTGSIDATFAKEYISKYRADLRKSKEDIQLCRERLKRQSTKPPIGRGRTTFRNRDFDAQLRQTQLEAFKLERLREQQDYERSRSNTPIRGNTPIIGNTPMRGNSPTITPRSDRSHSSSPGRIMTPREHKEHLIDLRRQLVKTVLADERRHRSSSPWLVKHSSLHILPQSQTELSCSTNVTDLRTYYGGAPRSEGIYESQRSASLDRLAPHSPLHYASHVCPADSPTISRRPSPRGTGRHRSPDTLDTKVMADSIYSPQESEQILREIEEIQQRTHISAPMEELLRRSSFSSSHSPSIGGTRSTVSPSSPAANRPPRVRSLGSSPAHRPYDQPLSLNLDSLQDATSQPYSPYSAYAREHIIPSERSPSGAMLQGSFELYDHVHTLSVSPCNTDSRPASRNTLSVLDTERIKHLRSVGLTDVKGKIGQQKW